MSDVYLQEASLVKCWKCKGSGIKTVRIKVKAESRSKKELIRLPCPLCESGFKPAAALNNTTKPIPQRILKRGFVRPFNPLQNWICPGPVAITSIHEAARLLGEGEMITSICGSWSIFQLVQGHRYTTDDLSAAAIAIQECLFVEHRPKRHIDIGCGLGSVLLFVKWFFADSLEKSVGVEAQAKHVELARKSIVVNMGTESEQPDACISTVRLGDLRDFSKTDISHLLSKEEEASFDLVTGTPPYFPVQNGSVPTVQGRGMCSFELRGGVETYCLAASRCLEKSDGARFVFVQTAIEIKRSEEAVWNIAGMQIVKRIDFYGSEKKVSPLFVIFVCRWPDGNTRKRDYLVTKVSVRTGDGSYTKEYHDLLVLVGKPPMLE